MPSQVKCAKGTMVNLYGVLSLNMKSCCATSLCNIPIQNEDVFAKSSNKSYPTKSGDVMLVATRKQHFPFLFLLISFISY